LQFKNNFEVLKHEKLFYESYVSGPINATVYVLLVVFNSYLTIGKYLVKILWRHNSLQWRHKCLQQTTDTWLLDKCENK